MDNFNRPYFSKSVAEFWKRWHISLSTWFRDYLYIPLGGNRAKTWRWQFNLFVTFLVSGFWHGANWTYVIWGGINGFYMIGSLWTRRPRAAICQALRLDKSPALHKYLRVAITFSLVCVAWVFFRASSVQDAFYILTHMFQGVFDGWKPAGLWRVYQIMGGRHEFIVALLGIGLMEAVHAIQRHRRIRHMLIEKPWWVRWAIYYGVLLMIVFFGVFGRNQFIYFQF
jgi:D-alanyl-lipoteichoic acid acyltransferase DltB (MBOAT superfamily)